MIGQNSKCKRMNSKTFFWIVLLVTSGLFSCNSPKRQKKINDGKLFEKLKGQEGYLNAEELKRLERDFSLKLLDRYDLSGYDDKDTLASFIRTGSNIWIASCYLENVTESHYPFFRLAETKEKGYQMLDHGTIPAQNGDCAYELDKLMVRSGEYIFISQKNIGNDTCTDSPLVFHSNGKEVKSSGFSVITWSMTADGYPVQSAFKIESQTPEIIRVYVHEKVIDTEIDEEVGSRNYDLNFVVRNNTIYFRDTVFH